MTNKGVNFLTKWFNENVLPVPVTSNVLVQNLANRLMDEAHVAGFTVEELGIDSSQIERFIRDTIHQFARLGWLDS